MSNEYYRDWRKILSQFQTPDDRDLTPEEQRQIFKNLNLEMFTTQPTKTLNNYGCIMKKCRDSGNPQAHYVEGILEYFCRNNIYKGLFHLEQAANGLYDDGIYLYSLLLLCTGKIEKGKNKLTTLGWETNTSRADTSWKNIRRSLRGITVHIQPIYRTNMRRLKPPHSCHRNDMDNRCQKCYHYKLMKLFVCFLN